MFSHVHGSSVGLYQTAGTLRWFARLPLSSSGRGNEAYGPDINSPIKNRRTQTNKVAANWRGKEGGGGDTVQKWNVFMFSCSTNGSYFPPLGSIWADIAHDTVGAVKHTFGKLSLVGQLVLLHPVIFYSSRDTVCVFTGMDGNSL